MRKGKFKKITVISLFTIGILGGANFTIAQTMSSANYKIQADSANVGGILSNSSNYRIEDTVGEIATGESSSASYKIKAGYQQMHEVFLSMTAASDVVMGPSINGNAGGTANGSTQTTVTTDSASGYQLSIKAGASPAMQGHSLGSSISNYTPSGTNPDFTFFVPPNAGEFGFTPEGNDTVQKYKDDGSSCNSGSSQTADACWNALTTTNEAISSRTSSNQPSGTVTTVKFRITLGTSFFQIEDNYTATSTLTAVSL